MVKCCLIPWIDTNVCTQLILDRCSIDTPSTLQLILDGHSNDISGNSQLVVNNFLIDTYEYIDTQLTIDQMLNKCWSSVSRELIGMSIGYKLSCWSRASIKSIDWHSTGGTFSTHNPSTVQVYLLKTTSFTWKLQFILFYDFVDLEPVVTSWPEWAWMKMQVTCSLDRRQLSTLHDFS